MAALGTTFAADFSFGEFPDEFQQLTFGPLAAADLSELFHPLFVTDREIDIEQITFRNATAGNDKTITFYKAASGTALSAGTAIGSGSASGNVANTVYEVTLSSNTNIAAGSLIGLGAASGLTTLAGLMVTVRTRTKRPRVSDGSKNVWNG